MAIAVHTTLQRSAASTAIPASSEMKLDCEKATQRPAKRTATLPASARLRSRSSDQTSTPSAITIAVAR